MAACLMLQRRPLSGDASCPLKTVSGGEEEGVVLPQGALQSFSAVAFCSLECTETASSFKLRRQRLQTKGEAKSH